jgi:hypothetical protein
MFKKTLSLVTVAAFLLFDWACLSIKNVPVTSVTSKDQIVGVTKISGESMQIPKENAAQIVGDRVVLKPSVINAVDLNDIKNFRQNDKGVVYEITTKDGRTLHDIEGKKQGWKIVFPSQKYEPAPIPLSEVNLVSVRRFSIGRTLLLIPLAWGVISVFYPIYLALRGIKSWWYWTL